MEVQEKLTSLGFELVLMYFHVHQVWESKLLYSLIYWHLCQKNDAKIYLDDLLPSKKAPYVQYFCTVAHFPYKLT